MDDPRRQFPRAAAAATIGTAIELYDFFLYGVAAALVFPKRFFPAADPTTATLLSFATFFVGFAARPIGAAIFGHIGDRVGRKSSLIATLLLMGLSTAVIGVVPGYEVTGVGGAVLLTLARVAQGIGVGGEWGGSVLLATEWGGGKRRGFFGSLPQCGIPIGLLLANAAIALASRATGDAFLEWGWRLPFLASVLLVALGLFIRVGIDETPAFASVKTRGVERAPVVAVFRRHAGDVLLIALARAGEQISFYIFTTFLLSYATTSLAMSRDSALFDVMCAAAASTIAIPTFGWLADRVGPRRLFFAGCALMIVWPFAYFALLDTKETALILVAAIAAAVVHDVQFAPQAAVIAESFPSEVRYSGVSLGFQLASIIAGGPTPLIAAWLLHTYASSTAIALWLSLASIVSLGAIALLLRRRVFSLDAELTT